MTTTHEDKSSDKPRQRGRKGGQREHKAGRQKNPKPDQRVGDQVEAMTASSGIAAAETAAALAQPSIGDVEPAEVAAIEQASSAGASPTASANEKPRVNIQTIATAYRDYTRKSVQENRRFVEKLMGVQSLDKAVEVQADYAKQAYENFVTESQRIFGLYSQLAGQAFNRGKRQA